MKRAAQRVYREHGIKYFAFPVVVVLLLASLFDEHLGPYLEKREEVVDQQLTAENNESILALNEKIVASHDKLNADFQTVQQKVFVHANAQEALQAMQGQLQPMLQSLYFDGVQFTDLQDKPVNTVVNRISLTAHFQGVPQQLPRLQAALAQAPKTLGIENLELKVVPDPQRGGQQLDITMRLTSLHMKPMPAALETVAAAAATAKNNRDLPNSRKPQ
ncbi:hypothetical protein [Giesbergeria anulus]|uniref:Type IV pilus assembly protein PilO n=1 Tax=Giesbergeria anulus TaxID=180197 RepID=A0A1H9IZ03_9BURK|nr:hypothetical protein [Giesbergeria anulus]SEQ79756.1 hypothetical protein SAMN02982919_01259 [Giesbergeria anulus]